MIPRATSASKNEYTSIIYFAILNGYHNKLMLTLLLIKDQVNSPEFTESAESAERFMTVFPRQ